MKLENYNEPILIGTMESENYNIVAYAGWVYGMPRELGPIDLAQVNVIGIAGVIRGVSRDIVESEIISRSKERTLEVKVNMHANMRASVLLPKDHKFGIVIIPKSASSATKWKLWKLTEATQPNSMLLPCPSISDIHNLNHPNAASDANNAPFCSYETGYHAVTERKEMPLFLVMRHPLKRLESVWKEKIASCGRKTLEHPSYDNSDIELKADPHYLAFVGELSLPDFSDISYTRFLEYLVDNQALRERDGHWCPASILLGNQLPRFLNGDAPVIPSNALNQFFRVLIETFYPSHLKYCIASGVIEGKVSVHSKSEDAIDIPPQELLRKVNEIYSDDIVLMEHSQKWRNYSAPTNIKGRP